MVAALSLVAASLIFHVDSGEHLNVVYNIACLAQQMPCTKEKYDKLWNDELRWSTEDQAQLDRWQSIVRAAEIRAPAEPAAPLLANYLSFFPAVRERQAILAAAFDAPSIAAFEARAARAVPADDARALAGVLRHFQARLHPWWERVGRQRVSGVRAVEHSLLPAQRHLIGQVASFVHADPDIRDVYMHVVPSPDVANDEASGTVVRNHFFMELVPPDPARPDSARTNEMVVSVAIHELTHALYDSAPLEAHLALMRQFVDEPDRAGPALYAFLNEGIATAVQEIAAGLARKDDSPNTNAGTEYRHAYIPRLGHAAVGPLEAALAGGTTMIDGFARDYVRGGRAALGAEADTLAFAFSAVAILASDPMMPAARAFRDAVGPTYTVNSVPEWRRAGELSAVFLLDGNDVRQFADQIPDLASLMAHRGFAFITPYKTRGHVLVLSGRDAAAVIDVVKQLRPQEALPKDGVVLTLD